MSETRLVFISYFCLPNYAGRDPGQHQFSSSTFGFGEMTVEVDFPIRNRHDLSRALEIGLAKQGITGRVISVISWQFYE